MTLVKIRDDMTTCRQEAEYRARDSNNTYVVIERLRKKYIQLDSTERKFADIVISEWILSEDAGVRFDAIDLSHHFNIRRSVPALRRLASILEHSTSIHDIYERKKVVRMIEFLCLNSD